MRSEKRDCVGFSRKSVCENLRDHVELQGHVFPRRPKDVDVPAVVSSPRNQKVGDRIIPGCGGLRSNQLPSGLGVQGLGEIPEKLWFVYRSPVYERDLSKNPVVTGITVQTMQVPAAFKLLHGLALCKKDCLP
eukprot:GHVU01164590.1.p2 GENE.GHVU01164590.1~~GHVU01164590.1.p2  ORF type:complete len:133 (-),score=9.91 GHVU01164590.1:175-573(-)